MTSDSAFLTVAFCLLPLTFDSPSASQAVTWDRVLAQPAAWYASAEAERIADNVLLYQRAVGGWPKDVDMARPLDAADRRHLAEARAQADATIDNSATVSQLRYLARVHATAQAARFRSALLAGLEYVLSAQYANGGWPQYFPLRADYSRHITLNDGAMTGVLTLLREVSRAQPPVDFVDAAGRARAEQAVARGLLLMLRMQVSVDGRLTGWAQQYDERTLQPVQARTYEHAAIASQETVGVVRFLIATGQRDRDTAAAIEGAVAWLNRVQIRGQRVERRADASSPRGYDLVMVADPSAPPIWARFYEIGTDRPFYSGRDGVKRYRLADIDVERRTGYSWLGPYATTLLAREYPAWAVK